MFNCSTCKKTVGPRLSPMRVVTAVRPKEYYRENPETGEMTLEGKGIEISKEKLVCRPCNGVPYPPAPQSADIGDVMASVQRAHEHVRNCKKAKNFEDCVICTKGMLFFASLPLPVLSRVLSN